MDPRTAAPRVYENKAPLPQYIPKSQRPLTPEINDLYQNINKDTAERTQKFQTLMDQLNQMKRESMVTGQELYKPVDGNTVKPVVYLGPDALARRTPTLPRETANRSYQHYLAPESRTATAPIGGAGRSTSIPHDHQESLSAQFR